MIGKVLNSRYKVTELIGEGGMALVYKAKDLLLDRWVALKVLRPQLVSDKDFVNRFHREARAVASLSHPNIVNIYDIGQDKEIHYLVMENVQGESLNETIKRFGVMPPTVALEIAIQICEALVVAHKNNIVHCDIKPHNILITKEGRVKVTDFGIARAVNSATLVQTETVIGTAHYFSPEQARGETINARSDLYSLGVVLYEMLTGQVPFRGDSPISVALKHINEDPLPPSQLNEKLPKRIDKLVMRSMVKDPNRRFTDASEMLRALQGMEKTFDKQDVTIGSMINGPTDDDRTQVLPRIKDLKKTGESAGSPEAAEQVSVADKLIKPLLITLIALIFIGIIGIWALDHYMKVPVIDVPNFVGMSKEEADDTASKAGVKVVYSDLKVANNTIPVDHVADQDIEPGRGVKKNRQIVLTLSKGPELSTVPDLSGKEMREVTVALNDADLALGQVTYDYSPTVPKNGVISQTPAIGTQVKLGDKINIVISKGPAPAISPVPNLISLDQGDAQNAITGAGFVVGTVNQEETTRYPQGKVAKQDPTPLAQLPQGSPINLVVSSGIYNPKNLPVYPIKQYIFDVPTGPYEQRVQIFIEDDNGREEIYNQIHHPNDRVVLNNVYAVGPAVIQTFINGEMVDESRQGM